MVRDRMEALLEALDEGAITRRILYRAAFPKKFRKAGEKKGAELAASPAGQALLKKAGILGLPTRVASKVKVGWEKFKGRLRRKKAGNDAAGMSTG
jgi:hypothetical protein